MLASLSVVLLGALSVSASPAVVRNTSPISLPIARRLNLAQGASIKEYDNARIQAMFTQPTRKNTRRSAAAAVLPRFDVSVTNGAVEYTATVGVGDPATDYTLIVDTGSSNTWVGADKAYVKTSTSEATGVEVEVEYGSGEFEGEEYLDTVTLASGYAITSQSIGVASSSEGFDGVDGILGIGPYDLTCGTLSNGDCIDTVTQNAYSQGLISVEEIGISFEPTTSESVTNGQLDFGGTDSSRYTGDITYTAITSTSPASEYVGITQSISYNGETILSDAAGIVDTGTTLLYLPSSAYDSYISATGATYDDTTGLIKFTTTQYDDLQPLDFTIGGATYSFTANAQIWPRSMSDLGPLQLNTYIGGESDAIYGIVSDLGSSAETGFEFIDGYVWLERFYFVYNSGSSEVGFATTSYTDATTN
ncbi:acid protease [Wolfiporia cocos MD-104 SS10]|uniref:Acid protease n=1 Tax=Wolfiporia cocos (strain MD-104) TaxID=742152 RepID=A0A2H3J3U7_WOLCO|nr:acid protease [Wolfiporia cocos MD-104 SS10]